MMCIKIPSTSLANQIYYGKQNLKLNWKKCS